MNKFIGLINASLAVFNAVIIHSQGAELISIIAICLSVAASTLFLMRGDQ